MRQFAVIGLGRFGYRVAETLAQKGASVIAIDRKQDLVEKISEVVKKAVQINSTDEKALEASGIKDVDAVVIGMGEDIESSILTTALVKNMEIEEIICRACTPLHAQILKKMGATRVVFPEEDIGIRVANSIFSPGILEYIELGADYTLTEIGAKEEWVGSTFHVQKVKHDYKVNVLIIKRKIIESSEKPEEAKEKEIKVLPTSNYKIQEGDVLVVLGDKKDIEIFEKKWK
ncbi:MAG: TrkA family potassium uptake protein [Candidatus Brocadiaceae bacterium]|nr:TrkA family potassium uptake protein [Candidatus Brocadiaceae bacterium]